MKSLLNIVGKGLVLIVGIIAIVGGGTCLSTFGWSLPALIGLLVMAFGGGILWLTFGAPSKARADSDGRS